MGGWGGMGSGVGTVDHVKCQRDWGWGPLLMFGIAQAFHCTVEEMCGLISGEWFCGGLGKWGRLLG